MTQELLKSSEQNNLMLHDEIFIVQKTIKSWDYTIIGTESFKKAFVTRFGNVSKHFNSNIFKRNVGLPLIDPVSYVTITKQEVCKLSKQQITDLRDKLLTELISQINCTDINNQFSAKLRISMECE